MQVFINFTPHPTFKLRRELSGTWASSKDILVNPAGKKNYQLLEMLEGKELHLNDGVFLLKKFRHLGDYRFDIELVPVT